MLDSYGRSIDYLRVSLTDRCNLRCVYCMPEEGISKRNHQDVLRFEEILKIVKGSASLGIKKIRYTGGEPLILKGIDELIYNTSLISTIEDISLTTNGILLYDMVPELKKAGLKRVNISLDTLNPEKYSYITRGGDLSKVIGAIDKCMALGIGPVKINVVLMKDFNDKEVGDFINLTKSMPISIRFIELMPIGEGEKLYKESALSTDTILEDYPNLIPITNRSDSTARLFKLKNGKGTVGLINPVSCKFCNGCNKIRLTPMGTIKPCLHSESEINIKEYIYNEELLIAALKKAITNKPLEHHLDREKSSRSKKMMYQIGG